MKVKSLRDATREHCQCEWIPRSPREALKSSSLDARQIKTGHFKSSVSRKRFPPLCFPPSARGKQRGIDVYWHAAVVSCHSRYIPSSWRKRKKRNKKKLQHILPAGSLSDYLTALGLAWQPAEGGEETKEGGEERN